MYYDQLEYKSESYKYTHKIYSCNIQLKHPMLHIVSFLSLQCNSAEFKLKACADTENFVRGVQLCKRAFFLIYEGGSNCQYALAMIGLPAKRHLNGISLTC